MNNIVTVFNSTLPDPAPIISNTTTNCRSRDIIVDYTVTNINSTDDLPANTTILFFADNLFVINYLMVYRHIIKHVNSRKLPFFRILKYFYHTP